MQEGKPLELLDHSKQQQQTPAIIKITLDHLLQ